jgi:hypothetical protein
MADLAQRERGLTLKTCRQFFPLSLSRLSSISMISTKSFLDVPSGIRCTCTRRARTDCRSSARFRSSACRWAPRGRCWSLPGLWLGYQSSPWCSSWPHGRPPCRSVVVCLATSCRGFEGFSFGARIVADLLRVPVVYDRAKKETRRSRVRADEGLGTSSCAWLRSEHKRT